MVIGDPVEGGEAGAAVAHGGLGDDDSALLADEIGGGVGGAVVGDDDSAEGVLG